MLKKRIKSKKVNSIVDLLFSKGLIVKAISAEQYGKKRCLYIYFGSMEHRVKAEQVLEGINYKVERNYSVGNPVVELTLGSFDEKYDGPVELYTKS